MLPETRPRSYTPKVPYGRQTGRSRIDFMRKMLSCLFVLAALLCAVAGYAQDYPILDKIAEKVIQKYQTATCEQLWQERANKGKTPVPPMEQKALEMLKADPQMRAVFINKVAAPIANKMFECGMIP